MNGTATAKAAVPIAAPGLARIVTKAAIAHSVTYMACGMLAASLFDYARMFADPALNGFMRQTSERMVMAGPLFQPLRGALFGFALFLLRSSWLGKRNGWLTVWGVLLIVGIFGTFGPAPGSLEGMIYTRLPLSFQVRGLPEVIVQALAFSALFCYWAGSPRKWLTWTLGSACFLGLFLPAVGLLIRP